MGAFHRIMIKWSTNCDSSEYTMHWPTQLIIDLLTGSFMYKEFTTNGINVFALHLLTTPTSVRSYISVRTLAITTMLNTQKFSNYKHITYANFLY